MSIDISRRKTKPGVRLLTVADLAELPSDLPSGPVVYELDNGRLVIMPPPGDTHGGVEANLVVHLKNQGDSRGHGKTRCGDVSIILWQNPDRVVGADVAFIANRSLPIRTSKEGYLETIPDLVVEVRSKNDTGPEVENKVRDYLKAGVSVVWVADPKRQTVTAYRRGRKPKVFAAADTLTVEDVIPDFALTVADVFRI
jgi:Uma2 family endonuclease